MREETVSALRPWFPDFDVTGVRLVHTGPVAWFVRNVLRQGAMTFSPFIFFGEHEYEPGTPRSLALLAHELHHIQQYRDLGHARFLFTYLRDRLRAGQYSTELPLERPAYALQARVRAELEAEAGPASVQDLTPQASIQPFGRASIA